MTIIDHTCPASGPTWCEDHSSFVKMVQICAPLHPSKLLSTKLDNSTMYLSDMRGTLVIDSDRISGLTKAKGPVV